VIIEGQGPEPGGRCLTPAPSQAYPIRSQAGGVDDLPIRGIRGRHRGAVAS
jgi:hypothetical protein